MCKQQEKEGIGTLDKMNENPTAKPSQKKKKKRTANSVQLCETPATCLDTTLRMTS